ncbi:efflux RND transporter periplasmic adaptor subunit [Hydrogenimonas cancrithermarum]|uniref:RND efflux pump membrane fusion protein barrel-sandwich domain-containing protein n=1 Tax=Hydrogenimonas cancrithermarum TaxID=2993563 RepID=A0ABN6WZB0_9BACT|nr:efflux RND transporter periplasmic adaptor subunit [Hydrogenimonas cancrithermarum]BDY13724.1 hypothetical protein HCR_20360 [Hydrogenimonas cancrithermarum]
MKKISLFIVFTFVLQASDIVIEKATMQSFGKQLRVNAKIVQLSNQRQQIVSRLGGHLETYYVEPGQTVKRGGKIAKIQSLELSKMTADYLALGKKIEAVRERLASTKKLYEKGLASKQDLNREQIALAGVEADRNALASQLRSLGIDPGRLKSATDTLIIHAHADGLVSRLLVPLHTNVSAETPIVSLVQKSGYYAVAYIGVKEALKMPEKVEGRLYIGDESFSCRYLYLMPKVDEETQRAQMLFWIESSDKPLLLNAFAEMDIDLPPYEKRVAVKRSALTMFEGEWVVFVPKAGEGHEKHEHEGHEEHDEHGEEDEEHHHEEVPFETRVVEIIASFGDFAAVKGIEPGVAYVADGVYFVKSMMLKSELGGHGH